MPSLILNRPWSFRNPNKKLVEELSRAASFPRSLTAFLINRGLRTTDAITKHLSASLSSLSDPLLMKDMEKAVKRVQKAVGAREKVGIFGDYDGDGVTAAALLYLFLKELGLDPCVYIPHREKEGYGLNRQGIDYLASKGCTLVVTVDCGITNMDGVGYCLSRGLDIVVTDHHQPLDELPAATACVNPKRKDCPFPFKELSGVGVVFFLVWALRRGLYEAGFFRDSSPPNLKKYLDLVAIGTVTDMMPLYGDNRILVKAGLEVLSSGPRPGIRKLMNSVGLSDSVTCRDIAFRIGPRLNAAGRIHHAERAFGLLVAEDEIEAARLAQELNSYNQQRQHQERKLLSEVLDLLKGSGQTIAHVLYGDNWPKGILGLVASKASEYAKCPVILLSREGEELVGSGRAPDHIDLFSALCSCKDLFMRFGGHRSAAGLKMVMKDLDEFRRRFSKEVAAQKAIEGDKAPLELDMEVEIEEFSKDGYVDFLEMLEPFGPGYEEPLFSVRGFDVKDVRIVGQNHLKLSISSRHTAKKNRYFDLLAWGHGHKIDVSWSDMEIALSPSINRWNGRKNVQFILKDARKP